MRARAPGVICGFRARYGIRVGRPSRHGSRPRRPGASPALGRDEKRPPLVRPGGIGAPLALAAVARRSAMSARAPPAASRPAEGGGSRLPSTACARDRSSLVQEVRANHRRQTPPPATSPRPPSRCAARPRPPCVACSPPRRVAALRARCWIERARRVIAVGERDDPRAPVGGAAATPRRAGARSRARARARRRNARRGARAHVARPASALASAVPLPPKRDAGKRASVGGRPA